MKILVVRLSSLGDILHLFPAVSDLQRHFPGAEIHWLTEPAFAEMVGWHAAVKKVITAPLRAHKKIGWKLPRMLRSLRRQLRAEQYDVVLDAQGLLKSVLLARLAGVAVQGFHASSARESLAALFYQKTARVPPGLHIIEKNRQLIAGLFAADVSAPADFGLAAFRQQPPPVGDELKEMISQPYLILLHGTTWSSKYWPESSWAELIGLLAAQGWRCMLPWGNQDELLRAQRLCVAGGKHAQVLPKLSLGELMSVVLRAHAFVSVESGIGHLATVLDVPGIMLHGPTSAAYSGILDQSCQHIGVDIYCSPCFKRDCPRLTAAQKIPPCQQLITPQQVSHAVLTRLNKNAAENDAVTVKMPFV